MQIVIEIPENILNMVCNTGTFGCYRFNTTKAIKNGIALPKGHGRLIDADKLANEMYIPDCYSENAVLEKIIEAPTIIEADKKDEGYANEWIGYIR